MNLEVVVDTREQRPWSFSPQVRTVRAALPAGDYSLLGLEGQVSIERKSLPDFVGTLTTGRERFMRELQKLAEMDSPAIVVEGSLRAVIEGNYRSQASPKSLLASAASFWIDWGVPVFFCGDRACAAHFAEILLKRAAKRFEGFGDAQEESGSGESRSQGED